MQHGKDMTLETLEEKMSLRGDDGESRTKQDHHGKIRGQERFVQLLPTTPMGPKGTEWNDDQENAKMVSIMLVRS
jgi:hypothetical protein